MDDRLLGTRRQQILTLLKKNKGMTAQELAEELAISSVGVRQHLTVLERDGLVAREEVHTPGKGRPRAVYHLTPAADQFFPQTTHRLLLDIVEHLREVCGDEAIDEFFASSMNQQKQEYLQRTQGMSLEEKVAELARIRDENGYIAEAENEGGETMLLIEHHCPIFDVAKKYPQACQYELELFRKVLGVNLTRDEHFAQGGRMCRYRIVVPKKRQSQG